MARKSDVNQMGQYLNNRLNQVQNIATNAGGMSSNLAEFLVLKEVISQEEYNAFLQEKTEKLKLAKDIREDPELDRSQKITKAKEADIPENWVVVPEVKEEQVAGEEKNPAGEEKAE